MPWTNLSERIFASTAKRIEADQLEVFQGRSSLTAVDPSLGFQR
ncbi:hypothetical protein HMPREF9621_02122 [Cutibacterium modestum HL037PA2]|uniref:Uncharacterized protein n=1 Tax=Cutibacterium modestum HL044PA1 TaxID=765109 RepID=A0ABN0C758_9ACTN|nr:hypothetical protein HMPREF9621_02122 [Cutibacterium modestum HL037PA2]EFS93053.1 hypothetical protein HMPREF9607_00685 [Cutibacterium modestum HL044PA1]